MYTNNYRRKPTIVKAVHFTTDTQGCLDAIKELGENAIKIDNFNTKETSILVQTNKGMVRACLGNYLIKHLTGELELCKAEDFERDYEII